MNPNVWSAAGWGVTARRLIYDAFRSLGVLRPGQGASADGMEDALGALNDMVDAWNTESLMIPSQHRNVYALTAGESNYTIGPTGTIQGERPQQVSDASLISDSTPNVCTHLETLPAAHQCGCQCGIYIGTEFPNATVFIYPAPTSGQSLALTSAQVMYGFADLDTPYDFAPGYARALRWNLACELIPLAAIMQKIGQPRIDYVEKQAVESKAAIKSMHSSPPPIMRGDAALTGGGTYNIITDTYY